MKGASIWRISALWIGAFGGALALHIGIGAQLYFKSIYMNDIVFPPMVMLLVEPEIMHPNVNADSEILELGVLKQEEILKSELSKVHPEEHEIAEELESIVEKSNFTVLKPLEKSSPSKINRKVFIQKQLSTLNVTAKKINVKKAHSFTASRDNNTALFDNALSGQWLAKVQAQLEKQKNYIVGQRISSVQGVVQLEFKVSEQGDIFASRIMLSSGNQELDWLAMMTLKRVDIFPPPPREMVDKTIRVSLIFS
ncbi:TonB protein [Bartonella clarridgeiae 73]|uniref:TonB protein n=1 Tax=Bartonella clarridgeiae (strain CCUG 45776 / CIP 104772 / 73) TaxID=696125 RepID=E6YGV9_BARC7|nr:energy transducer TonB [Bartonella clarridgeiae]WCR55315.1 MAG: putative TonB-dependent receptor [Bartonella clarridgeiae]CBI76097.1 TonB protein [Bartonella clarridgeiae 73]